MKTLIFIVEGEAELELVKRIIIPYLTNSKSLNTPMDGIIIKISGGGHGFNNIEHFKNTIRPVLHRSDEPVITTMIDHYGINSEQKLPGYSECIQKNDVEERLLKMEEKLQDIVQTIKNYRYFVPYIQRHELETLLFADPDKGFDLGEEGIKSEIKKLSSSFSSIEDINCTTDGAPSKRLDRIYSSYGKKYNKVTDAIDIIELTTIDAVLEKCPRFKNWIETLIAKVSETA